VPGENAGAIAVFGDSQCAERRSDAGPTCLWLVDVMLESARAAIVCSAIDDAQSGTRVTPRGEGGFERNGLWRQ